MNYDVFVSYSTQDKLFVDALVNRLESQGIRCWYAPRDIPAGMTWPAAITAAIKTSGLMLLVFSEAANASQEVSKELTLASSHKCLVVPVRIENVSPSPEMEYHLTNRHWLDVHGLEVEAAIASILETLRRYENLFQHPIDTSPPFTAPQARVVPPQQRDAVPFSQAVGSQWQRVPARWRIPAIAAGIAALFAVWLAWPTAAPVSQPAPTSPASVAQKPPSAAPNLEEQAKAGDANAQYALGVQWLDKDKKPEKASTWMHKAAQQNHREAQYRLGDMYYSGIGVKKDYKESAKWYILAAKNNHTEAQSIVAGLYQQGTGVEKNDAEAFSWYQKSANQGNISACYGLAEMYEYGQATQQSASSAFKWYLKAAEGGDAAAQYKVGFMYHSGMGVQKNSTEAVLWLRRAAEQGDQLALELLGQIRQ